MKGKERKDATQFTERLLAKLGIRNNEIGKLQMLPMQPLRQAVNGLLAESAGAYIRKDGQKIRKGSALLLPVVDGDYLPAHPFDPVAVPSTANIPLLIGTNRDEPAISLALNPGPNLAEEKMRKRLLPMLGDELDRMLSVYKKTRPDATPYELFVGINSSVWKLAVIELTERKLAVGKAPVYMYLLAYKTDYKGGAYGACHTLDIPFVFDTVDDVPLAGNRPDKHELAAAMSKAWACFAYNSNPSHAGIPEWLPYTVQSRATMILDVPCRLDIDPDREELEAWQGLEIVT